MKPIQRTFVRPTHNIKRVNLSVPHAAPAEHAHTHDDSSAACEVREMDGRLGRIEWRDSVRDFERAFQDTFPTPLV